MKKRLYYSLRTGKNPNQKINLEMLLRLFGDIFDFFFIKEYFQEAFGYDCVDMGPVPGLIGHDIEAQLFRRLRKGNLWPIREKYASYSEDDLFDVIEFLYDHISKPVKGFYHEYSGCGWHYQEFDRDAGRNEFREEINDILQHYNGGFELAEEGEILHLPERGLEKLLIADLPVFDPDNVEQRIIGAEAKFRRYRSSFDDRRDAIRDLADVLEYLRPKIKQVLTSKDESDLFNIANNFGIRHHNEKQQTNYDKAIWYSWIFYYYLATIHAVLRLIEKQEQNQQTDV